MTIFNLPDLGEGLPDAEIHEWFVKEGDTVIADEPMVSMETAKAVVDVPCPQSGTITRLYGNPGDIIKTGEPLVAFIIESAKPLDKGTVVGNLEESTDISEDHFIIGSGETNRTRVKTTPSVRLLAKKLNIELNDIKGTGSFGTITREDVEDAANKKTQIPLGFEPLRGVRRAMLNSMIQSHQDVVPVSIFDEVDIESWPEQSDITVRIIRAIEFACLQEPALNAWFDAQHASRQCFKSLHLGLAMDNDEGLFVPVIHDVAKHSDETLRQQIDTYKKTVHDRTVATENLKGATFILSNFGKFAGRFANPIILPPMVAILAVGKLYQGVVNDNGQAVVHNLLPLSLSFDHRAVTGGEATRFLGAVMTSLARPS